MDKHWLRRMRTVAGKCTKLGEVLAGLIAEAEAFLEAEPPRPKGWQSKEFRARFAEWVRVYTRCAEKLKLPLPFKGGWAVMGKWYDADRALTEEGIALPWLDESRILAAMRQEAAFNHSLSFVWLCTTKDGVPNMKRMLDRYEQSRREVQLHTERFGEQEGEVSPI